jgi:hypothetical protein
MLRIDRREDIERAARVYKTNKDAAAAMGMSMQHFGRLCRKFGVPTPYAKRLQTMQRYAG